MQAIEIFKVGTHTAMNGQTVPFDRDALAAAVAAYKPDVHEAPIVVGHPKDNHPAFGWIDHLELTDDGVVLAHPKEVDADFAELVKAGRYKKRSASWYTADSPANPTPGTLYLRHVGFLGAQPPALKGLGDVQFNEAEEGVLEFGDTSPYVWSMLGGMLRGIREWLIGKEGAEIADQIIPNYQIDELTAEAERQSRSRDQSPINSFSEPDMTTKPQETAQQTIDRLEQELATEKAANKSSNTNDFSEKELAIAKREAALAKREVTAKIDDLVAEGKVLPAHKAGLVEFMAGLDGETVTIEFGEGAAAKKQSPREFMTDFLSSLPKLVDFGEAAGDEGGQPAGDMTALQLGAKTAAYHKKQADAGNHISFTEAAAAVQAGQE